MRAIISMAFIVVITASLLHAQSNTLDHAARSRLIERVLKEIAAGYIYSEKAPDIAREIHRHEEGGIYDTTSGEEFARRLTKDLQSAAHDLHFDIDYSSDVLPQEPLALTAPTREDRLDAGKDDNYGFRKIEILEGNVGYIAFDAFYRAEAIGETLAAAVDFVTNTDALILDLRNNDGGRADAVALLVSYFVEGNPQQLVGIYWKPLSKTVESFTSPSIKGKKYLDRNVYLLTSKDTISAAEAFCYDMKNLKLATLVGEATAGAADPGSMERLDDHFSLFLPTGRAVDTASGKNWEGTGINPDVVVRAADSLGTAQILALKAIQEKGDANKRQRLEKIVRKLEEKK
jgi:hypothetical protein